MARTSKNMCTLTGNTCGYALPSGIQNAVPGEGLNKSALIFVGESPGTTELRLGKPFRGRAGQLLNDALIQIGVNRSNTYITNACLCNQVPLKTPTAVEWKACRTRLINEIKEHSPKVVVALGSIAMKSLLPGERRVKEARGEITYSEELNSYVVVTLHPAAVLRSPALWSDLLHDLKKAKGIITGEHIIGSVTPNYSVAQCIDDLMHLSNSPLLAVDTEGDLLCVGLSNDGQNVTIVPDILLERADMRTAIRYVLMSAKKLLFQNAKYDWQVLVNHGLLHVKDRPPFEDTMLMSYCLDERRGTHGLKYLAREHLNLPAYADEVKAYMKAGRLKDCPPEVLYPYNALDVCCTFQIFNKFNTRLNTTQRHLLDTLLYPASNALSLMEHTGIKIDTEMLKTMEKTTAVKVEDIKNEMYTLIGKEFNPNSPKQIADILYEQLELPVPYRYSTDAEALKILVRETKHPFPKLLLDYRLHHKTLSTYLKGLTTATQADGRIRTNFNLIGTVTGRLSSSNPNLQNITRGELRNIFVASPGYTLIEFDLQQAEIRAICWLARDEKLREVLLSGEDVHTRTACMMFNKNPEEVSSELRTQAKRISFGLLYGMSASTLARDLQITVEEAAQLADRYFSIYPGVRAWMEQTKRKALTGERFYTPFGRTRNYDIITKENSAEIQRQAVDTPPQSLAADITLSLLVRLDKKIQRGDLGRTRLLLTVHDSGLSETAEDVNKTIQIIKTEINRPVLDGWIDFPADIKAGERWGSLQKVK